MKTDVWVSKATFELRKGETIEMFLQQLTDEMRQKFEVPGTRANDYSDEEYVWTKAVQPGHIIFIRNGRGAKKMGRKGMYATEYTRDKDTYMFSFGEPVAVMEEKEFTPIQKSADFIKVQLASTWHGLGL